MAPPKKLVAITPPPVPKGRLPYERSDLRRVQPEHKESTNVVMSPQGAFDARKGTEEVVIQEAQTDGRRELDRVCQEKGLVWGIIGTSLLAPGGGKEGKVKLTVLIGSKYEFEAGDAQGYPHACDAALVGLAAELESEG